MDYLRFLNTLTALCDVGLVAVTCLGIACAVELLQHLGVI